MRGASGSHGGRPITAMKIKFFTTGGTIDKVYFDSKSEFEVGSPMVVDVLKDANVACESEVESILRKDSLDMSEEDRRYIREKVAADPNTRIIITHGTDTMVQTAEFLQGIPGKTIVLTGSMQPARFRLSDATFNIGASVSAVQCLPPGVYIIMNGRVFHPPLVRKNRQLNRFEDVT